MINNRVKISSIVENQLPQFVREEFPLVQEFLSQYYLSMDTQGSTLDILQNIDQYVKVDNLTNLTNSTTITSSINEFDSIIFVESVYGFPDRYGLLKIDDEIITYESLDKQNNSFVGCVRGFSGISSLNGNSAADSLEFSSTNTQQHLQNAEVKNLSILFLQEFFNKIKKQVTPGFENRELFNDLNQSLFIKQSTDFYSSKGTDSSFKILFGALYGKPVDVIKPRDFLIRPSDAQFRVVKDLVVEAVEGNPLELENFTLNQDQTEIFNKARATVTKVEKISRSNKEYYVLSLDSDYDKDIDVTGTIFGSFSIHPKTRVVSVSSNFDTIDVDSTVGFPNSGTLVTYIDTTGDGVSDNKVTITYTSKSLTQFYGCVGITSRIPEENEIYFDAYAYSYVGVGNTNLIKVRVGGVLSDLEIRDKTFLCSNEDTIKIKSLGLEDNNAKANNWIFNIPLDYRVKEIRLLDNLDFTYSVTLYDEHNFLEGDRIKLRFAGQEEDLTVVSVNRINNKRTFNLTIRARLDENLQYVVRKELSRVNYPGLSSYTANVQNIYYDNDNSFYVASPSFATYLNQPLEINARSIRFLDPNPPINPISGIASTTILNIPNHNFYTGDSVYYSSKTSTQLVEDGIYFVKKLNSSQIQLTKSRTNIDAQNFIVFYANIGESVLEVADFYGKSLEPQKLLRKISDPENTEDEYVTAPESKNGIFINGVELLNYKSSDTINYGPIEEINVTSRGSGYDIINPPNFIIEDSVGTGATGYCSVIGGLERIDVIEPGFDYIDQPQVIISGGNGRDAIAEVNLASFDYSMSFSSTSISGLADTSNYYIGFSTYHKFRKIEEIVYDSQGQTPLEGLVSNSTYFISTIDSHRVRLHKSFEDASAGINTIPFTNFGVGNHLLRSKNKKKRIGSISIKNSGSGYQNKNLLVSPSGISAELDIITISNHGYKSGELVFYTTTGSPIGGLTTNTSYYVDVVDNDRFRLSLVGTSSTVGLGTTFIGITTFSDFYYNSKQFINLTSSGSGIHKFNYQPISVSIVGTIGVSSEVNQDFSAKVNPIFRGEIDSVYVTNGGRNYGSEIINYNRQPRFKVETGVDAQISPVILDGKVVDAIIINNGKEYTSSPELKVIGSGTGAILSPVVNNGKIVSVNIISSGGGYDKNTTSIVVVAAGSNAKFEARIRSWRINLVERLIKNNQITSDDSVVDISTSNNLGLQYCHAYPPRKLRRSILSTDKTSGTDVFVPDLLLTGGIESSSNAHSPILGWSYDGHPIYGPYGYTSKTGGSISLLRSGYKEKSSNKLSQENRPKLNDADYPLGFFIEDYEYIKEVENDIVLDEYNGRFCVTPEYPTGIYAYFCTVNDVQQSGPFNNYRRPVFPYIIGDKFKSKPIDFNFDPNSNQDKINLNETNWIRNSIPYLQNSPYSNYRFILNPNKIKNQNSIVSFVSAGIVTHIGISSGGNGYRVNDKINFNFEESNGRNLTAKVASVFGKEVISIAASSVTISNIDFIPQSTGLFVGYSTLPHNLKDSDIVSVSGFGTFFNVNTKIAKVGVNTSYFSLGVGVGTTGVTGIVTYFNIRGIRKESSILNSNIRENDILQIQNEKIKVLETDELNSRIKVIRCYDNSVGSSYTTSEILQEIPRRFSISLSGFKDTGLTNSTYNKEIYFNPSESIGLGSSSGVGIGSTLFFNNPGVGVTQITIPTRSIYLPNHNLKTGDILVYSSNGGSPISVSTNGASIFSLTDNQILYAAKISNNLIGLATSKIGIGSTGDFVQVGSSEEGILYFDNFGSGDVHSFKTLYSNLIGNVKKNIVTVSTAETHGLSLNSEVNLNVISGISTSIKIYYNDANRRLAFNPRSFIASSVDVVKNTITISNHRYYKGEKVIHTSNSPSGGLENEKIYYVAVIDSNTISLSQTKYDSELDFPNIIDISSANSGIIYQINPQISLVKNQIVTFDLSDASLSFSKNSISYTAFDFNLYTDSQFKNKFYSTSKTNSFEVSKSGDIGFANAKLVLKVSDDLPDNLYYNLTPIDLNNNTSVKKEIYIDTEINNYNKLIFVDSTYSGRFVVSGITTNTFSYQTLVEPERNSYTNSQATITYNTKDTNAYGAIDKIKITSNGFGFKSLPSITSVNTDLGNDAIFDINTDNIGSIVKTKIQDIGFDYPSDLTLKPIANIPQVLKINPLTSFESIRVISPGINYNISPDLVVIDSFDNKIVEDVILEYNLGSSEVIILQNTKGINDIQPRIIPVNNSNGVSISTVSYNSVTKEVTVSLGASFSEVESFPFEVGDKVLIENINIISNDDDIVERGYNSSNYNYSLFTLTYVDGDIGGDNSSIRYSLEDYLASGEEPGAYNPANSSGRVIPEKYFPKFNSSLKKNIFLDGEKVSTPTSNGIVEKFDKSNEILRVSSNLDFSLNEIIIGDTSKSRGRIVKIYDFYSSYNVGASSLVRKGWETDIGFLNNSLQRIHDSDYYQYFSYSLKSEISIDKWNDPVSSLNHAAGFKKFGDLIVESSPKEYSGISTDQNESRLISSADLVGEVDFNCIYDFDLVRENNFSIDGLTRSNEIYFNSRLLQDYIESIGNRVLLLDNLSEQFNSNPRSTQFSIIDNINLDKIRSSKYIIYIQDSRDPSLNQVNLLTLQTDGSNASLNHYATIVPGELDFINYGYYDFSVFGSSGQLLFYPVNTRINNYNIGLLSINIFSNVGLGTTVSFGDSAAIQSFSSIVSAGTSAASTIVGISTSYRSSKLIVQISSDDRSYFEFTEISLIHNDSSVSSTEYGQFDVSSSPSEISGLGTFYSYISGSDLNLDFIPNEILLQNYEFNVVAILLGNNSTTGIGTFNLLGGLLESSSTSIASSTSPVPNLVSSYSNDFDCNYSVIAIEDVTNNEQMIAEIVSLYPNGEENELVMTQFGILTSGTSLGEISGGINTITGNAEFYVTPNPNIDVDVKVFQMVPKLNNEISILEDDNFNITSSYGIYEGTENDIKKSFELTANSRPVFKRDFVGNSTSVVNTENNTIRIPNHYFTTGEEIIYTNSGAGSSYSIGIGTVSVPGIGLTDKLPSSIYIVKVDESFVKVAASASEALRSIPSVLDLTHVGIGTSHTFNCKTQNTRAIITIDNYIQSPIVSTSITTTLAENINAFDGKIKFTGITSFYGGDVIRIGEELMKIESVGVGSTNICVVQRPWLGSNISTHSSGDKISKVVGNYNINNNIINFSEAPYGKVPFSNISRRFDEIDYIGIETSSSFSGRAFLRSGIVNTDIGPYDTNYIIDDISNEFNGISTAFTLKNNGSDITGFSTSNAVILINNIFQGPKNEFSGIGDYSLEESVGISSILFTGTGSISSYDVNTASVPRGGVILSVGSTQGFGYQPLVAAGGTAIVSLAGTISSISIGNSGSGYRSGLQVVNVGIGTEDLYDENLTYIGIATISDGHVIGVAITNPGIGYTYYTNKFAVKVTSSVSSGSTIIPITSTSRISVNDYISIGTSLTNVKIVGVGSTEILIGVGDTIPSIISAGSESLIKEYNPPRVIFDDPLSYSNIPLIYSSSSVIGVGTGAVVDIVVGQGSSVINFELKNLGYGYGQEEILTVAIGGTAGIPTDISLPFSEFELKVDSTYQDSFNGFVIGDLLVFDDIANRFDGVSRLFPLLYDNQQISVRSRPGSNIDVQNTLLIFINDILQVPGDAYTFNGGSLVRFTEAPIVGDSCKIVFYRGTSLVDTRDFDILEPVEDGDKIKITSDFSPLNQKDRIVFDILSSDTAKTNTYPGPGISIDENLLRPVKLCKQTEDIFIDNTFESKKRVEYESLIYPNSNIIESVGIGSTLIYVESVTTFFDNKKEYGLNSNANRPQRKVTIISQDNLVAASATSVVSFAGTISSIIINNNGSGYSQIPTVTISSPTGIAGTNSANATASISNGKVTSINITNPGVGYTNTNPPTILIEPPAPKTETIDNVAYSGDFGIIVGYAMSTISGTDKNLFDFYIPQDSFLRDSDIVGTAVTISQIDIGDFFVVQNSNVGSANTNFFTYRTNGTIIGLTTQYVDGIYQVESVETIYTDIVGIGSTYVKRIFAIVEPTIGISTIGFGSSSIFFDSTYYTWDYLGITTSPGTITTSKYIGNFSWGKIYNLGRTNPQQFNSYGFSGISTSPIVIRSNPLKYEDYIG